MANVRDFRTRIRSVKSTQQITRAMKLVSASKLRRSQEAILAARPYATKMLQVLSSLAARANPDAHPLLAVTERKKVLVVVLTADKGLCGSFNTNIVNRARHLLDSMLGRSDAAGPDASDAARPDSVRVELIGKKGRDWFRRRDYDVRKVLVDIFRNVTPQHAKDIATDLIEGFTGGEFDAVYLVYNEFKSVIHQRVVVEPLLPIPRGLFAAEVQDMGGGGLAGVPTVGTAPAGGAGAPAGDDAEFHAPGTTPAPAVQDYVYEPGPEALFDRLLPRHVGVQIYRALLESAAAEHGARMTAMDNATRNAGEMIDSLTLQMNKIRQASITKEILEVVSGAEALK